MSLVKGPLRDSFQHSQRTVPASQVLGTRGRGTRDVAGPVHLGALIAAKPRILEFKTQSQPDFSRNNCNTLDSQKHNPDRLIFSLPLLSQDAARLWRPEEMQHKQLLIVKSHTTDKQFQIFEVRASSTAPLSGQQMVDRTQQQPEPYGIQQTSLHAAPDSRCRLNPFNTDGHMKST